MRNFFLQPRLYPFIQLNYVESNPADQRELETLLKEEIKDEELRKLVTNGLAEFRKPYYPGSMRRRSDALR